MKLDQWPRRQRWLLMALGIALTTTSSYWLASGGVVLQFLAVVGLCLGVIAMTATELSLYLADDSATGSARRRYLREVVPGFVVYMLLMLLVWPHAHDIASPWLKALVGLSPVLPVAYVARAVIRLARSGDELDRRVHMQALGVAATGVSLACFALGLLVGVGAIHMSAFWLIMVLPAMTLVYCLARAWLRRGYRGG